MTYVLAIIKAIPILDKWFSALAQAWYAWKVESQDKAIVAAFLNLTNDQRAIEEVSGNKNAGAPTRDREGVRERGIK